MHSNLAKLIAVAAFMGAAQASRFFHAVPSSRVVSTRQEQNILRQPDLLRDESNHQDHNITDCANYCISAIHRCAGFSFGPHDPKTGINTCQFYRSVATLEEDPVDMFITYKVVLDCSPATHIFRDGSCLQCPGGYQPSLDRTSCEPTEESAKAESAAYLNMEALRKLSVASTVDDLASGAMSVVSDGSRRASNVDWDVPDRLFPASPRGQQRREIKLD